MSPTFENYKILFIVSNQLISCLTNKQYIFYNSNCVLTFLEVQRISVNVPGFKSLLHSPHLSTAFTNDVILFYFVIFSALVLISNLSIFTPKSSLLNGNYLFSVFETYFKQRKIFVCVWKSNIWITLRTLISKQVINWNEL